MEQVFIDGHIVYSGLHGSYLNTSPGSMPWLHVQCGSRHSTFVNTNYHKEFAHCCDDTNTQLSRGIGVIWLTIQPSSRSSQRSYSFLQSSLIAITVHFLYSFQQIVFQRLLATSSHHPSTQRIIWNCNANRYGYAWLSDQELILILPLTGFLHKFPKMFTSS